MLRRALLCLPLNLAEYHGVFITHCRSMCPVATLSRSSHSLRNSFRACINGNNTGWVPLEELYPTESDETQDHSSAYVTNERRINTVNQLMYVARKGLRCQVFDCHLWHELYDRSLDLAPEFTPRQWVELLHIYKRIKMRHTGLLDLVTRELLYRLDSLQLEDLSKLALCFGWHGYCHRDMFSRIADVVITRLTRTRMEEVPEEGSNEVTDESESTNIAMSKITSYTHLLGAFAKCDHGHKELFEAVAVELIQLLKSKEMLIPPGFLAKVFASYARFGYRHVPLFDALSKEMLTAKIPIEQLSRIEHMVKSLDYNNEILNTVFAYRLGNSVQAG
ncbi:hypothetical protein BBOV_III008210 [Babesia bovis T2Bo]|uniref:RAP domain-containing protein n=1 Tax=Babesia bovis TaxID=5865 RepID=A7AP97_BABBO|nr:hypothetical protein BBOV_III008210 [Babesia bovis T2Bo]EDO08381.1 hypothetical protein BBOV_III008210 [Babesia bovis T2Bo]|eukprot:XP_001611949.1 hypothetical protein [Babesia bovis T2Bo]